MMYIHHADKVSWYFKISEQTYTKLTENSVTRKIFSLMKNISNNTEIAKKLYQNISSLFG